jgi:5'(3')-deoxyribonucleotidase
MSLKIYVDLDGVVVNFVIPAMQHYGVDISHESQYPDGFGWNVLGATNLLRTRQNLPELSATDFWDGLNYGFWYCLSCYPGAKEFLNELDKMGDVFFATSPTLSSACVAAKYDWVKTHFRDRLRKLYIGADKTAYAKPGSILIDDRDRNVDNFIEAGGKAVLFPRPWNILGYDYNGFSNTLKEVKRAANQG